MSTLHRLDDLTILTYPSNNNLIIIEIIYPDIKKFVFGKGEIGFIKLIKEVSNYQASKVLALLHLAELVESNNEPAIIEAYNILVIEVKDILGVSPCGIIIP